MGQYVRNSSTFTGEFSSDLAKEYASYINNLGLKDPNGNTLTLKESSSGIYASGSYYDYMLSVTEESHNNFLNDTTFPYTPSAGGMGGMPSGDTPSDSGSMPSGEAPSGDMPSGEAPNDSGSAPSGNAGGEMGSSDSSDNTTYNTAKDYIASLNGNDTWIEYDEKTNTAKITSLEAFVKHCKNPSKSIPAFDDLNRSQAENGLFGLDANGSAHFDKIASDLLKNNSDKYSKFDDYSSNYADEYQSDLEKTDAVNSTMQSRVDMYNPMYYLCDYYNGSGRVPM